MVIPQKIKDSKRCRFTQVVMVQHYSNVILYVHPGSDLELKLYNCEWSEADAQIDIVDARVICLSIKNNHSG